MGRVAIESSHQQDGFGFSAGLVLSPVCGLESWDFDVDSYRHGNRRQWRLCRISTDIKVVMPWGFLNAVGMDKGVSATSSMWQRF